MNFASTKRNRQRRSWLARWRSRHCGLGQRGERAAAKHLKRQRFRILARNYRCPAGEIDLICSDRDTLVFVEVKTRSDESVQLIDESVHPRQWRRLRNAANFYLMKNGVGHRPCRFDLVTVLWREASNPYIEHLTDVRAI